MDAAMSEPTRWSLIDGARRNRPGAREGFARRYEPVVRAYLGARWNGSPLRQETDDAAQEVFALCFSTQSPLDSAERRRDGGFRAYLFGVVRNVARGFERKRSRRREQRVPTGLDLVADEPALSEVYDRAWARSLLHEAADLQRRRAVTAEAARRVEILRLRFADALPVCDIAERLDLPRERAHREYARARREYKAALADLVRASEGGTDEEIDRECRRLLDFFS
jgi:RNA polymerase sigma-70 factor (ECF subfamily)